jgi:hypothetical protein
MKVSKGVFKWTVIVATILAFILNFGSAFMIVGLASMLKLVKFSWTAVLIVYALINECNKVKDAMMKMNVTNRRRG